MSLEKLYTNDSWFSSLVMVRRLVRGFRVEYQYDWMPQFFVGCRYFVHHLACPHKDRAKVHKRHGRLIKDYCVFVLKGFA